MRSKPLFVYVLEAAGPQGQVEHTYLGLSSNPLRRTLCHNRERGLGSACKTTRPVAPRWRLRLVTGPFYAGSRVFYDAWRNDTRKADTETKLAYGVRSAQQYYARGLRVWSPTPKSVMRRVRATRVSLRGADARVVCRRE